MTIAPYDNETLPPELLGEPGGDGCFPYYAHECAAAWRYCRESAHITFVTLRTQREESFLHAALIIDDRLPAGEAFYGFMAFPDDPREFEVLWGALLAEARSRDIRVLKGPIQGSIWHQYRCIEESDGSPWFKSEPRSPSHHAVFYATKVPARRIGYYSAARRSLDTVIHSLETAMSHQSGAPDLSLECLMGTEALAQFARIADIARLTFSESWGYTELEQSELASLYPSERLEQNLSGLYIARAGSVVVGFCSSSRDGDTLILKTIAILPEWQKRGIGTILAHFIHMDAREKGVSRVIYALIREGNTIQRFPHDDVSIVRRYAAFEFII